MRWRGKFPNKADDCMDAGGRATQEQLPSLHVVNEYFFGKFNDTRASEVIFQSFPRMSFFTEALALEIKWTCHLGI
jgi:hypothetical protein